MAPRWRTKSRMRTLWIVLLLSIVFMPLAMADTPVARNLVYHAAPGHETEVMLKAYDKTGDKLLITITSLPENGQLYQLSQVYSIHGYEPKREQVPITTVPTVVTGSKSRVIFKRPQYDTHPLHTKYAEFRYTATNSKSDVSNEGMIVLTTTSSLVSSPFDVNIEDWVVVGNGNSVPTYQPLSRAGGLLSYYIYAMDDLIHHQVDTGDDSMMWYFAAPSKFLGHQWAAYGGSLDFVLSSAEGNFDMANLNKYGRMNLVLLECASCNHNLGITLGLPMSLDYTFDGSTKQFRLPLQEHAGWLKDPQNVIREWTKPTQCEFVDVLSDLSSIRILGDFTKGHETVALDSVTLRHGDGYPRSCYAN